VHKYSYKYLFSRGNVDKKILVPFFTILSWYFPHTLYVCWEYKHFSYFNSMAKNCELLIWESSVLNFAEEFWDCLLVCSHCKNYSKILRYNTSRLANCSLFSGLSRIFKSCLKFFKNFLKISVNFQIFLYVLNFYEIYRIHQKNNLTTPTMRLLSPGNSFKSLTRTGYHKNKLTTT